MSRCKDCIHLVACVDFWYSDYDCFDNIEQSKEKHENDEACVRFKATTDFVKVVRCKDCKFNVANMEIDKNDGTDYSGEDIVCSYFMTDGLKPTDYCSRGEMREE